MRAVVVVLLWCVFVSCGREDSFQGYDAFIRDSVQRQLNEGLQKTLVRPIPTTVEGGRFSHRDSLEKMHEAEFSDKDVRHCGYEKEGLVLEFERNPSSRFLAILRNHRGLALEVRNEANGVFRFESPVGFPRGSDLSCTYSTARSDQSVVTLTVQCMAPPRLLMEPSITQYMTAHFTCRLRPMTN